MPEEAEQTEWGSPVRSPPPRLHWSATVRSPCSRCWRNLLRSCLILISSIGLTAEKQSSSPSSSSQRFYSKHFSLRGAARSCWLMDRPRCASSPDGIWQLWAGRRWSSDGVTDTDPEENNPPKQKPAVFLNAGVSHVSTRVSLFLVCENKTSWCAELWPFYQHLRHRAEILWQRQTVHLLMCPDEHSTTVMSVTQCEGRFSVKSRVKRVKVFVWL